jgi:hypothetical protein
LVRHQKNSCQKKVSVNDTAAADLITAQKEIDKLKRQLSSRDKAFAAEQNEERQLYAERIDQLENEIYIMSIRPTAPSRLHVPYTDTTDPAEIKRAVETDKNPPSTPTEPVGGAGSRTPPAVGAAPVNAEDKIKVNTSSEVGGTVGDIGHNSGAAAVGGHANSGTCRDMIMVNINVYGREDYSLDKHPDIIDALSQAAEKLSADSRTALLHIASKALNELHQLPENKTVRGYDDIRDVVGVHKGKGRWFIERPQHAGAKFLERVLEPGGIFEAIRDAEKASARLREVLATGRLTPDDKQWWSRTDGEQEYIRQALKNARETGEPAPWAEEEAEYRRQVTAAERMGLPPPRPPSPPK